MNTNNEIARKALANATGALFELDGLGCTVHCVTVREGRPAILIGTPSQPLPKSNYMTQIDASGIQRLYWSDVLGCRVEWTAREPS